MTERGLKALENWAKQVTNGYNGVNVRDMSSSFRDGLAFCAIIHHYYPELIDFESLSKENILHNNSLAFSTAEKQLGVPALLDAEDMVKYSVPDRLSVITYLSQLHNCFENQNKANRVKPVVKRVLKEGESGPPAKVPFNEQRNSAVRAHELCQICKHRVFILERLMVSGKLYHRTCFRCCKCNSLLKPGAYVESDSESVYECAVCPHDEKHENETEPANENLKPISLQVSPESNESTPSVSPAASPKLPSYPSSVLTTARNSFLQRSIRSDDSHEYDASIASGNSSLSELSSMSVDAATEETQPSSLDTYESTKEQEEQNTLESTAASLDTTSEKGEAVSSRKPYQSVFTREIASLRPLIINRTEKKGNTLHSYLRSPDSARINGHDIPLIKSSTYFSPYSLPRPSSVGNFHGKKSFHMEENDEDITQNIRRGSLDANKNSSKNSLNDSKTSISLKSVNDSDLLSRDLEETKQRTSSITSESNGHENSSKSYVQQLIQLREASIRESNASSISAIPAPKAKFSRVHSGSWSFNEIESSVPDSKHKTDECDTTNNEVSRIRQETPQIKIESSELSETSDNCEAKLEPPESLEITKADSDKHKQSVEEIDQTGMDNLDSSQLSVSKSSPFNDDDNVSVDEEIVSEKKETVLPSPKKDNVIYPDDLNPFGDDDEAELLNTGESYPDTLNPFGDDDDEEEMIPMQKSTVYDESKNPFADDDDEEDSKSSGPMFTPPRPPVPAVRMSILNSTPQSRQPVRSNDSLNSPTGSVQGTLKKRQAPKPPHVREIFQNGSHDISPSDSLQASPISLKGTSPSPKLHKGKRAPPPPSPRQQNKSTEENSHEKEKKDTYNIKIQSKEDNHFSASTTSSKDCAETQGNGWKKKKRPAPPVPIPPRREVKKIPLKEIQSEMNEIEEKQMELEKQGRELEELIRDRDKDEEPTVEEEECIMQLFELVNQKNVLFRRQAELMYIKRSQRLEEQQVELEFQIRCLFSKPTAQKTKEDEAREEQLMQQLLDVVDQRNDIIDSIEMDRRREAEEDISVQEQTEIKISDLPITAEIKEKSAKKSRDKKKKEKKKKVKDAYKNETLEIGKKGTIKKKWF